MTNKQDNAIKLASQGIKEAQLAGDQAKLAQYTTALTTAQQRKQDLLRENTKEANQGKLKGAEAQAKYLTEMDVESVKSAREKQTDLKSLIAGQEAKLIANGAPADANTHAKAQELGVGLYQLAQPKLNLATQEAADKNTTAQTKAEAEVLKNDKGYTIASLKLGAMDPTDPGLPAQKQLVADLKATALAKAAAVPKPADKQASVISAAKPTPALPLPVKASDAVKGQVYNTINGPAIWDGTQFVQVSAK